MTISKQFLCAVATAAVVSFPTAPLWAQISETSKSAKSTNAAHNDRMISADKLQGAKVVDNQNKDVGKIKQIFVDPQSGRVQRADVDFSTGTGDTYSVTWKELHVTRNDNGDVVAKIDQSVIRRVQQANDRDKNRDNNQRSSSR